MRPQTPKIARLALKAAGTDYITNPQDGLERQMQRTAVRGLASGKTDTGLKSVDATNKTLSNLSNVPGVGNAINMARRTAKPLVDTALEPGNKGPAIK